jgi:hypothetical protein
MVGQVIYIAGGIDGVASPQTAVYAFDINTETFTTLPSLNTATHSAAMVAMPTTPTGGENPKGLRSFASPGDFRLFYTGGDTGGGGTAVWEIFDPRDNAWVIESGHMAFPRAGHGAILVQSKDGTIFLAMVGGYGVGSNQVSDERKYMGGPFGGAGAGSVAFTKAGGRNLPAVESVDGIIYAIGGVDFADTATYDDMESSAGFVHGSEQLLENFETRLQSQSSTFAAPRDKRRTLAFREGHIWGVGTWHADHRIDLVKIGE